MYFYKKVLLLIATFTLQAAALNTPTPNDLLHQGIRENNPAMVREALKKGARMVKNPHYAPAEPLVAATQQFISTVKKYDHSFIGSIPGRLSLAFLYGIASGCCALAYHPAAASGGFFLPIIHYAIAERSFNNALKKHHEIIDQILQKQKNNPDHGCDLMSQQNVDSNGKVTGSPTKFLLNSAHLASVRMLECVEVEPASNHHLEEIRKMWTKIWLNHGEITTAIADKNPELLKILKN